MATWRQLFAFITIVFVLVSFSMVDGQRLTQAVQPDDSDPPEVPEELLRIDAFLEIDPDCLSPCWWGFDLGQATPADFQSFFIEKFPSSSFEEDAAATVEISQSSIFVQSVNLARAIDINFFGETEVVDTLTIIFQGLPINNELLKGYDLPVVINAYGAPDRILVNTLNAPPNGESITLIYDKPPLAIEYSFLPPQEEFYDVENDLFLSCFRNENLWSFHLLATSNSLTEYLEIYESEMWSDIETTSDYTVKSFSEAILDGEQPCIALPAPPPVVP